MRKLKIIVGLVLIQFGLLSAVAGGQVVVDRTIATVSDGAKTELITYSDLLWQLALQPNAPLESPTATDLNTALQLQINQRIFALEAQRLPRAAPTDKEISDKIAEILTHFPSAADFERRLRAVGFDSIKDDNFENMIAQRVAIEKYIDFRFRSFVVITADDETKFYADTWMPRFRVTNPGAIVPSLTEVKKRLDNELTESRVASEMETFLDQAKRRINVVIISEPK